MLAFCIVVKHGQPHGFSRLILAWKLSIHLDYLIPSSVMHYPIGVFLPPFLGISNLFACVYC